jgi:tetratricopeptide (TPR) repeat protein
MNLGREVKDFIAAWQAGEKILGARDDAEYKKARTALLKAQTANASDPETQKLTKDALRARINASNRSGADVGGVRAAQANYYNARTEGERQRQKLLESAGNAPVVDPGLVDYARQNAPVQGAIPTDPSQDPNLTYGFEGGGAVPRKTPHYADGGYVEPDDDEDTGAVDVAPEPDIEGDSSDDDAGGYEMSSQSRTGFSVQAANDAVRDGMNYGTKALGLQGGVNTNPRAARAYAMGRGAIRPEEMEAVRKAVDPEGKMPEGQRNMAALGSMYQFYLNKGDTDRAQKAAFGLLQNYRVMAARYGALAAAAAEKGDTDQAIKAALKAYDFVPDGQDLKITKSEDGKLSYVVTDMYGKQTTKGIATPQQLGAMAMRVGADGFDQFILSAAGQRASAQGGGATGGGRKSTRQAPADKDAEKPYDERVTPYREDLDKYLAEDQILPGEKKTTPGSSFGARLKSAGMEHLKPEIERVVDKVTIGYRGSPRVANEFVMKAAFDVDPNNPDSPPPGIQLGKDGTAKYRGETFKIDSDTFDLMSSLRGQAIQAAKADKKKKDETATKRKAEDERVASFKGQAAGKPSRRETLQAHFGALPIEAPASMIAQDEETKRGALDIPL